ncbi:MAG: hypothetical protein R6U92_07050, partial [Bacillota bacterium]
SARGQSSSQKHRHTSSALFRDGDILAVRIDIYQSARALSSKSNSLILSVGTPLHRYSLLKRQYAPHGAYPGSLLDNTRVDPIG